MFKVALNSFPSPTSESHIGGIAKQLDKQTVVERCFVAGEGGANTTQVHFSGITEKCSAGTIRQCAVGAFKSGNNGFQSKNRRIAAQAGPASTLENNVALDCHSGESNPNGLDGKSLPAALFTQHYFEHTLGWDFKNVWQWNDIQNQPELRWGGVNGALHQQQYSATDGMGDLLTQQLNANLWL